jgi:DNA polymerase-3 subunit epsilon
MDSALSRRLVVLDTETTGFDPADGHRIVEVACVELVNLMPSGRELHFYCNPERDMPAEAFAVHGLATEFLTGQPRFADQVERFEAFMDGAAALVAHNAEFDVRFLNAERKLCGLPPLSCEIVCSLVLARRKYPGAPASLDALCRRFEIDLSERVRHGALIDTRLLARVYLELMGGQQPNLDLAPERLSAATDASRRALPVRPPRPHVASAAELAAHEAMLDLLTEPLWRAQREAAAA